MKPKARFHIIYLVVAVAAIMLLQQLMRDVSSVALIPYSEFQHLLHDKKIADVEVVGDTLQGTLKQAQGGKTHFVTTQVDPRLADKLDAAGVKYARRPENTLLTNLLSWVVPGLLMFFVWAVVMRRMAAGGGTGGLMAVGKSKAKVYVETDTKVTFGDVAGVDEAKQELQEIVAFLKDPQSYGRLGARMPKGVLLVGPPGTGKTLLARAVAGEASVPFFSISGSEFVEMFVGVGAARVRDLFEQARKQAPSIIFIDELDALGRARNAAPYMGGHDEKEQTLNQLLVELDGFDPSSGLVLLAATNRPEILDSALLRAGRFDRQVLVDRPDKKGRVEILKVHTRKAKLATALPLESVAALTPGFTGADLANLVNEAALVATRRNADEVTEGDFVAAIERIVAGLEKKNRLLNPFERKVVAYHEMGHALVARSLPGSDPVQKVSIIPRGIGALGYTMQRPTEDRYLMTREELENKLTVLLGGRAAEHVVFGHLSTGAADDLSKATDIARSMATRYAMVPELGNVAYDSEPSPFLGPGGGGFSRRNYSEVTAHEIDAAIKGIVDSAFDRARALVSRHREALETGATRLLEKETLTEDELSSVLGPVAGSKLAAASA
ncbi:MAG TPA: ATP-dependent zinc metalloprotease FtsH [Polyangiales bacterium]